MSLPHIAAHLARALRNAPCSCVSREVWPWKEARVCARCRSLAEYEAFEAIVQTPDGAAAITAESVERAKGDTK